MQGDTSRLARHHDHAEMCFVVPPHIFEYMADHAERREDRERARRAIAARAALYAERDRRGLLSRATLDAARLTAQPPAPPTVRRLVHSAGHGVTLPGALVRSEGQAASADAAANQACDGSGATWAFYQAVFGRNSVDDHGLPLVSTVHYDREYDNAFWNGSQMIYGDGDGTLFRRFTSCLDVIGHELTHGVTQYTAHLAYHGESGALNESVSDVFGALVKQHARRQTAVDADWLIGEGLLVPKAGVRRTALRSMKAPGTAYDDPSALGHDPQPAHMTRYVHLPDTPQGDFGGVHINSGIPNRAFYEAAVAFGGHAWDKAGQVWYQVLTGGALHSTATFAEFRDQTVQSAGLLFGKGAEAIVTRAWAAVGL